MARCPAQPAIRLLFLIHSLNTGGAERQLIELVRGLDKTRFDITVVTCYDGGALLPEMERIEGATVISMHKRGRWESLSFLQRLIRTARAVRPQIVLGNYGFSNILSLFVGRNVGARVVWGVRASGTVPVASDRLSTWNFRVDAWLSRWPDLIIANSHAGRDDRIAAGFCAPRMVVIQNGIDIERFHPDRESGRRQREQWGIPQAVHVIGLAARLDPIKDHPTFLRAAAALSRTREDVRFVCVGDGVDPYRAELHRLAVELGLREHLIWAGECRDMRAVYNAFDIATLSSTGEGLPNVVAEAMACGVPCVVTDVGDAAIVVSETGLVVPPGDAPAMARAWTTLMDASSQEKAARAASARERIERHFAAQQLAERTEAILMGLL